MGLVVWSGGNVGEIPQVLSSTGCEPRSVWATRRGGGLVGFLFGAPDPVNASFRGEFSGGTLPASTPLVLVCAPPAGTSRANVAPAPAPPAPTSDVGTSLPGGLAARPADEAALLNLLNGERATYGLTPFTLDSRLVDLARRHSADMVARAYFSHTNPDGLDPFQRMAAAGISYLDAAENIAWGPDVAWAHNALMNSPGHRANILNPNLHRIGIGIVPKDGQNIMVTQAFID